MSPAGEEGKGSRSCDLATIGLSIPKGNHKTHGTFLAFQLGYDDFTVQIQRDGKRMLFCFFLRMLF